MEPTIAGNEFINYIFKNMEDGNWGGMQTVRFLEKIKIAKQYSKSQCREFLRHIIEMDNPQETYSDAELNQMLNPLF